MDCMGLYGNECYEVPRFRGDGEEGRGLGVYSFRDEKERGMCVCVSFFVSSSDFFPIHISVSLRSLGCCLCLRVVSLYRLKKSFFLVVFGVAVSIVLSCVSLVYILTRF